MKERFAKILEDYGALVTLRSGSETAQIRAFIQPVLDSQAQAPYQVNSLGFADDRRWIYLGVAPVAAGDRLEAAEGHFTVRSSAAIYAGKIFSHWWAALEPEREAAD